jgi:hypothetical protein
MVTAVAVIAARRVDQSGYEKRFTMYAVLVAVGQPFCRIVAGSTAIDLVDRRSRRTDIRAWVDVMWIAMAVKTASYFIVHTARKGPQHGSMTHAAGICLLVVCR